MAGDALGEGDAAMLDGEGETTVGDGEAAVGDAEGDPAGEGDDGECRAATAVVEPQATTRTDRIAAARRMVAG